MRDQRARASPNPTHRRQNTDGKRDCPSPSTNGQRLPHRRLRLSVGLGLALLKTRVDATEVAAGDAAFVRVDHALQVSACAIRKLANRSALKLPAPPSVSCLWTNRVMTKVSADGSDCGRGPPAACVDLGELRAEQDNLRRVIDPQQHEDQRYPAAP